MYYFLLLYSIVQIGNNEFLRVFLLFAKLYDDMRHIPNFWYLSKKFCNPIEIGMATFWEKEAGIHFGKYSTYLSKWYDFKNLKNSKIS